MSEGKGQSELGEFLQACRARIGPEAVGLPTYGERRRVAGLRREELALLAGVSASYYTRLEQGQSRNASPQVLDAIAGALRLSPTERQHLSVLVDSAGRAGRHQRRRPPVEHADPAMVELLLAVGDVPAIILGRRSDVLAWNPMGHALLSGHLAEDSPGLPGARPNMTEVVFLDPNTRDLYANWTSKARAVVGNLRLVAGVHPEDPALASLIGRLIMASPEFSSMWADHSVAACASAQYELRHPLVGRLTITQQTLRSVETPEQALVTCTAVAGSPSQEALALLRQLLVGSGEPRNPVLSPASTDWSVAPG